jgi:hypothetical protein
MTAWSNFPMHTFLFILRIVAIVAESIVILPEILEFIAFVARWLRLS